MHSIYHLIIAISLVANNIWAADVPSDGSDSIDAAEPAFPSLMDAANRPQIHITSESFDAQYGYETIEEFVDLESGKATWTSSTKQGHWTTFIDSATQSIYRYRPYTCLMLKQSELLSDGETGVWSKLVRIAGRSSTSSASQSDDGDNEQRQLPLFEVAAVWMNAAEMPKTYSKASVVYSSGKDTFMPAHKWTLKNGPSGLVHLFFTETGASLRDAKQTGYLPQQLSLEMIQEEVEGKIKRTINVLSVDYYIPVDVQETLMQVPLGYGCRPNQRPADFESKQQLIRTPPGGQKPNRLRMEVTATKFVEATGPNDSSRRSTDTVSVDLLVKAFDRSESSIQMVRQRNSQRDIKVVTDYLLRVQYSIDLRRGSCELNHTTSGQAEQDKFSVNFNNGLKIGFDWPILKELFDHEETNSNCELIKITDRGKPIEFLFEECRGEKIFDNQRPTRIMKKYSLKRGLDGDTSFPAVRLESVTVWVLNEQMTANAILESYHFYIVEDDSIVDRLELAQLFDVSEECYFNNDQMKYGRDYAWIELTYTMSSQQLDTLAAHEHQLKERILRQFRLFFDSLLRMPRVELLFTDGGLNIRLLLLDEPSIIYMWDSYPQQALNGVGSDDFVQETTVDAGHCADLCRLHNCQAMSYCSNNYACLIRATKSKLDSGPDSELLRRDSACTAWLPAARASEEIFGPRLYRENLHYILSQLRHEDLADLELPEMPDELIYPQSMTGLSDQELIKKQSEFLIDVYLKLQEQDKLLPTLAMMFSLDGSMIFMVPSKFQLDQDPLAELGGSDESDIDEGDAVDDGQHAAFHEGLPMSVYRLSAFREPKQAGDAHQFVGLSYDQCALACTDGRCSSFSYCKHRQDCIITNIYNLEQAKSDQQIGQDSDCFIAQRDFLSKFNEFANVLTPAVYKRAAPAHNPTECAHSCVVESEFNCLAFDYCQGSERLANRCYYLDSRLIFTGSSQAANKTADSQSKAVAPIEKKGTTNTGCSHYSRSYLAEFTRIAYREVNGIQLAKLKTSTFAGHSVDKCADICLNELADCTAFQFCFNSDIGATAAGGSGSSSRQQCTMIESRPQGDQAREFRIVQDSEGNIIEQGKFFTNSIDCHVFAMRRDTSEAQMRDVALEPLSPAEARAKNPSSSGQGMTLGGAFVLYLTSTAIFAAIGCGLVLVKHHSPYVSDRFDRFKARFGYY